MHACHHNSGGGRTAIGEDIAGRGDAEPHHDHRTRHRGEKQERFQGGNVSVCKAVCAGGGGELGKWRQTERRRAGIVRARWKNVTALASAKRGKNKNTEASQELFVLGNQSIP